MNLIKDKFSSVLKRNIITGITQRYDNWKELKENIFSVKNEQYELRRYMKQVAIFLLCLTIVYTGVPQTHLTNGSSEDADNLLMNKKYFATKGNLIKSD